MATQDPIKQELLLNDIPTKCVTIYPSRAHVVREIQDITIAPGLNELAIYGLTPTIDAQSVQVDGHGAATVTDMSVDENREKFDEVYPEDSDDEDESFSDLDGEESGFEDDDELAELAAEVKALKKKKAHAKEVRQSADEQESALTAYLKSSQARKSKPDEMASLLKMYGDERAKLKATLSESTDQLATIEKSLVPKQARLRKAKHAKRKVRRESKREAEKNKAQEKRQAKRDRVEKARFWPKKVYKITVTLEAHADTPSSSRRTSVSGSQSEVSTVANGNDPSERRMSLLLSYVTSEASWVPCYNISISSLKKTADITYSAEFSNLTSETWKDASVTLSTSQTSYSGLKDEAPELDPWKLTLIEGPYRYGDADLLTSQEKAAHRTAWDGRAPGNGATNRDELFGSGPPAAVPGGGYPGSHLLDRYVPIMQASHEGELEMCCESIQPCSAADMELAASIPVRRGSSSIRPSVSLPRMRKSHDRRQKDRSRAESLSSAPPPPPPQLDHAECLWADAGLTTTYDLPGARALTPSSRARRHKIATLQASDVRLAHTCVPKLRKAAFLTAALRNPSPAFALLPGAAAVALDGTFLGTLPALPRTAPGAPLELPLGVDPGVQVGYPAPGVRRATQGFLVGRERANTFARSVVVTNAKGVAVELCVRDQVPVSQDEGLRVEVVEPRGLREGGEKVRCGRLAREAAEKAAGGVADGREVVVGEKGWGEATAVLKEEGEVVWDVRLEKGAACLLELVYEARLPSAKRAVQTGN